MKPWIHAANSVRRFGGVERDYIDIHDFFDSSKAAFPDMRHRAVYHHSHGIYLAERIFGHVINVDGAEVSVRDIGEWHVIEDLGRIPTLGDYLNEMPFYPWLGGTKKEKITLSEELAKEALNRGEKIGPGRIPLDLGGFLDTASTRKQDMEDRLRVVD